MFCLADVRPSCLASCCAFDQLMPSCPRAAAEWQWHASNSMVISPADGQARYLAAVIWRRKEWTRALTDAELNFMQWSQPEFMRLVQSNSELCLLSSLFWHLVPVREG